MTTTVLFTKYPTSAFDPEVSGAPVIIGTGVAVDDTKVSAVLAAAAANGVTLLSGTSGAGPVPAAPSDPVQVVGATINYVGPPTSGTFIAGQQITDSAGTVFIAKGTNVAAGFYTPGTGTVPTAGSFTYDGSGRVTGDPDGNTYTYNSDDTIATITRSGVTRTATYGANGIASWV